MGETEGLHLRRIALPRWDDLHVRKPTWSLRLNSFIEPQGGIIKRGKSYAPRGPATILTGPLPPEYPFSVPQRWVVYQGRRTGKR